MKTTIEIDDDILKEAMRITKIKNKKRLVDHALQEYIKLCKCNPIDGRPKLRHNSTKKEFNNTILIQSKLSEEEKYKRRLKLLSLRGKVKMFN